MHARELLDSREALARLFFLMRSQNNINSSTTLFTLSPGAEETASSPATASAEMERIAAEREMTGEKERA